VKVPFQFFEDLHREHQRILTLLTEKIEETENLAKAVFSTTQSGASQENKLTLKSKIFAVCKMIYE